MAKKPKNAISPLRSEDYPEWYQQVIRAADLAETSPVRGCMVIKPWGYAIWENIQKVLDKRFKETGHKNAYFPLFIPTSFIQKESEHVEGFAKECAVVTHSRLESDENGKLVPAGELEEPLIVRPTSETIIGEMFSKWVQSYRDLPLLINQWANVVRWEMRTRLFLRTSEFLWQEGHTAHETKEEAIEETEKMLAVYKEFAEEYMAMPVLTGEKTEGERFPGATITYCIEAFMQDGKALQAGTSHFLGQNFAKSCDIKFQSEEGKEEYAWTTSWGVSTRLVGGMIMTHSDDDGLVLPPRLAPAHVVILPVIPKEINRAAVIDYCKQLKADLEAQHYEGESVRVELDERDLRGGEKMWSWIKQGIPVYMEVGPRDIENNAVFLGTRDKSPKERQNLSKEDAISSISEILAGIQKNLFHRARTLRDDHTFEFETAKEIYKFFDKEKSSNGFTKAGFVSTYWAGTLETENNLKSRHKVTVRCIPLNQNNKEGVCPFTGVKTKTKAIIGKSY